MPALAPFTPGASATLTVTSTEGRAALTGSGDQVLIFSPAANDGAGIKFGDSTVDTSGTLIAIGPGFNGIFTIPKGATHVAAVSPTGTATLYFTRGDGQ